MEIDPQDSARWRFGTRDLLGLTAAIAAALAAIGYAVKNSVSTIPQVLATVAGWFILAGCLSMPLFILTQAAFRRRR
jgi:hypothetical protein